MQRLVLQALFHACESIASLIARRPGAACRAIKSAAMVVCFTADEARGLHSRKASARHRGADQWLFVVAGSGEARVKNRRYKLVAGSLIFIARGERHEIRNSGRRLLRTLNFYVPPAYSPRGNELPRGKR